MATGTGKTLTSAAVIRLFLRSGNANRVLFLVDRIELENQAKKNFQNYLAPDYHTVIFKENVDDWRKAEVVVSTVQTLMFNNKYKRFFKPTDFSLIIADESHRSINGNSRAVFEFFLGYKLGLTATPKRDDGQEPKIFMQIGPVRYRFSAKDKVKLQGIEHYVYPRFTRLLNTSGRDWKINEAYAAVRSSEVRNRQIIADVEECLKQGRTPIVLTKFKDHADTLLGMLQDKADHVFLLKGGRSRKENEQIRENMKNVPANESMVLVAIGQYIGEGFNYPRLDTMMLTTPIAWQGNVEQYSGRLHRDYEGKRKVIIYDYVDAHIRVLDKMYYKRLRAYKKIGYEIVMNEAEKSRRLMPYLAANLIRLYLKEMWRKPIRRL